MQFADDVTNSQAGADLSVIADKLTAGFNDTKRFCDEHHLKINGDKTQLIILKAAGKTVPPDFQLTLDNNIIKPVASVKLLGVTIDQHLTMGEHIDKTIKKCHGIIGALRTAVPFLHRPLLTLAYTSLVRSHLEYCSSIFMTAAATHLKKLDVVQKCAARIICEAPRDAHAAPLLEALNLQPLVVRREEHIVKLMKAMLLGASHPAFNNLFNVLEDGAVEVRYIPRIGIGAKRFSVAGPRIYNAHVHE
jgi:hypothetical protein